MVAYFECFPGRSSRRWHVRLPCQVLRSFQPTKTPNILGTTLPQPNQRGSFNYCFLFQKKKKGSRGIGGLQDSCGQGRAVNESGD